MSSDVSTQLNLRSLQLIRDHTVIQRLDDKRYIIDVEGSPKTVSTDSLKPAHLPTDDHKARPPAPDATAGHSSTCNQAPTQPLPSRTTSNVYINEQTSKKVTFAVPSTSSTPPKISTKGVIVAPPPTVRTRLRKQQLRARPGLLRSLGKNADEIARRESRQCCGPRTRVHLTSRARRDSCFSE